MSDVLGDTRELVRKSIVATATHSVTGVTGVFDFSLARASGIRKYFESHAKVTISGPVLVSISGPVTSTAATSATIAVCPEKYTDWPRTEEQVLQLQGAVRVQHSLLVDSRPVPLTFGNETAEVLKPNTLVDYPPHVVGHYDVSGGSAASKAIVFLHVPLIVEGVAHHKTW